MKINPSFPVLNTTSFFASLTKTALYLSVDKQSEVNGEGVNKCKDPKFHGKVEDDV